MERASIVFEETTLAAMPGVIFGSPGLQPALLLYKAFSGRSVSSPQLFGESSMTYDSREETGALSMGL